MQGRLEPRGPVESLRAPQCRVDDRAGPIRNRRRGCEGIQGEIAEAVVQVLVLLNADRQCKSGHIRGESVHGSDPTSLVRNGRRHGIPIFLRIPRYGRHVLDLRGPSRKRLGVSQIGVLVANVTRLPIGSQRWWDQALTHLPIELELCPGERRERRGRQCHQKTEIPTRHAIVRLIDTGEISRRPHQQPNGRTGCEGQQRFAGAVQARRVMLIEIGEPQLSAVPCQTQDRPLFCHFNTPAQPLFVA